MRRRRFQYFAPRLWWIHELTVSTRSILDEPKLALYKVTPRIYKSDVIVENLSGILLEPWTSEQVMKRLLDLYTRNAVLRDCNLVYFFVEQNC